MYEYMRYCAHTSHPDDTTTATTQHHSSSTARAGALTIMSPWTMMAHQRVMVATHGTLLLVCR